MLRIVGERESTCKLEACITLQHAQCESHTYTDIEKSPVQITRRYVGFSPLANSIHVHVLYRCTEVQLDNTCKYSTLHTHMYTYLVVKGEIRAD